MCGIAVVLGTPPDVDARRSALESLRHRGPDGTNTYEEEGIFIGHSRLAILDLSDAARQPMSSPDGRFVLAYNGEIYNYVELRRSLGRRWLWRGSGDTETLLALLALEGVQSLPKVRGMFAFVLWDRDRRTLLAGRDPLGIKPLYCAQTPSATLLASELRTIRALGGGDRIDQVGVESFLLRGAVQGPRTILQGVRAVQPGHVLTIAGARVTGDEPYWQLPDQPATARPRRQVIQELDDLLGESVRIQLRSDVPIGVFLSGGLDSSLITSYAAQELGGDLRTYSVGFESQERQWDETSAAALVSQRYGTQHHRIVVTRTEFESRLEELPRAIDQPSVDGVNSYFVSGAAAGEVKVALSGQGGDELFAGYNLFQFASRLEGLNKGLPRLPRAAARLGESIVRLPARAQKNWYLLAVAGVLTRGDPDVLDAAGHPLFGYREINATPPPFSRGTENGDLVNAISRRLITGYLRNTLLRDMDAMSMAHSLEVRVPLVDHMLAELALSIPGRQKVAWGDSKSLLRELARVRLPSELLVRKKQGFVFPLAEWLAHPSCYAKVSEALAPDRVRAVGLVDPALVARELRRLRRPFPGDVRWLRAQRVWGLFVLHEWYDHWHKARASGMTAGAGAR